MYNDKANIRFSGRFTGKRPEEKKGVSQLWRGFPEGLGTTTRMRFKHRGIRLFAGFIGGLHPPDDFTGVTLDAFPGEDGV